MSRRSTANPRPVDRHGDLIQNSMQMCQEPRESEAWGDFLRRKDRTSDLSLQLVFSRDKFEEAFAYPVIVENWDKKNYGRVKRAWLEQFTEKERKTLSSYYKKFYRMYLITGVPARVVFRQVEVIKLIQRACNFFATC